MLLICVSCILLARTYSFILLFFLSITIISLHDFTYPFPPFLGTFPPLLRVLPPPTLAASPSGSLPSHFHFPDGLARAEASRATHADNAGELCCGGIYFRLCFGLISDNAADICFWRSIDFSHYCSQLAFFQSPSPQMVGPK